SLMHHRFTFVIAGTGDSDYETHLKKLLLDTGLVQRTRMVGFVEGNTKALYLQGSDVFALTSHSENFGVAVLEALASGLPAVVTPGVALAHLIEHHQFGIVSALDQEKIAAAILTCLNQPDLMGEMGDRARQFILENYTWDKIASQLIETYDAIINNKPLPHHYA
ncbi:MAG: glycosyltransferase, partial [Cyanobacteria bacterium J06633_2]